MLVQLVSLDEAFSQFIQAKQVLNMNIEIALARMEAKRLAKSILLRHVTLKTNEPQMYQAVRMFTPSLLDFVGRGMCADICIHDKGEGNPHAHVMLTLRPILPDGSWGDKSRREYVLDKLGERISLPSGKDYKSRKVSPHRLG